MTIQDGPHPPDQFAFDGSVYQIRTGLLWRLIDHVWRQPERRASVDSLAKEVWNDAGHDISYLSLASLRRDANRFFRNNNLPFKMQARQEAVMLLRETTTEDSENV